MYLRLSTHILLPFGTYYYRAYRHDTRISGHKVEKKRQVRVAMYSNQKERKCEYSKIFFSLTKDPGKKNIPYPLRKTFKGKMTHINLIIHIVIIVI